MRKILYFIGQLLFLPHVFLFLFSKERALIAKDIYARKDFNTSTIHQVFTLSRELLINKYFRTLFYYRTNGVFSKILRVFYPRQSSFIIDVNTKIGGGLQLVHPYATILNAEKIGENVYVNHLVTVGEKNGKRPVIGDNVELHANCTIIGGIRIGKNAIIGAGTVVTKDVPEGAVVIGAKNRFLERDNSNFNSNA